MLIPSLERRRVQTAGPIEEQNHRYIPAMVDIEQKLPVHEILHPQVLEEGSSSKIGNLENAVESAVVGTEDF